MLAQRRSNQPTSLIHWWCLVVLVPTCTHVPSIRGWWDWLNEPELCQHKLSRRCQIRHSIAQTIQACACHTHIKCDAQVACQLNWYMLCATLSMWVWQARACIDCAMLCLIWQCLLSFCWHSSGPAHQLHEFTADVLPLLFACVANMNHKSAFQVWVYLKI